MTMSLESIGQKLKAAREAQGLSLRQIYERTKIPINHLQSLDGGLDDDLPEPVYVAGFIKRYAECIGLDGQVLADEYRKNAAENTNGKSNGRKEPAVPVYVTPEYIRHARIDNRAPVYKLWLFNGLIIVVLVAIVAWYMTANNMANQPDPSLLTLKESAQRYQGNTSAGQPNAQSTTATNQNQAQQGNPNRISLHATQHVWVEVKAVSSGESLYTGYLEQGDRRDFEDPQGVRIRAGNGGNLSVEFKGKMETFGTAGKVAERTFTVSGAALTASTDSTGDGAPASASASTTAPVVSKPVKPRAARRSSDSGSNFRKVDDVPSRNYIPGEFGGTRSIDVPYRYSEGRLDAN